MRKTVLCTLLALLMGLSCMGFAFSGRQVKLPSCDLPIVDVTQ